MSTEIAKFDPNKLAEQLKDKIRFDLVNFLPDEVWQQMLSREIKAFLDVADKSPHNLRTVVREVLAQNAKAKILEILNDPDWQNTYDYTNNGSVKEKVGEAILDMMKNNMGEIFASMLSEVMAKVVNNIRNNTY
jgi:hypothetical protein